MLLLFVASFCCGLLLSDLHRLQPRGGGPLTNHPPFSPRPCHGSDAFEKRLVSKRYVALVAGELEGTGAITIPLDGKVRRRVMALLPPVPLLIGPNSLGRFRSFGLPPSLVSLCTSCQGGVLVQCGKCLPTSLTQCAARGYSDDRVVC